MQGHVFEYAVIRVVPRAHREEFLNVGVILYCPKLKFLQCLLLLDVDKLNAFCGKLDVTSVEANLQSFERICNASLDGGPIALLDAPSRFRWLTATRSTVVQASKVHPGLCTDAQSTLTRLFGQLVL